MATTTPVHAFPEAAKLCQTLTSLFGRVVESKPVRPWSFQPKVVSVVATFVETNGRLAAAWISEVATAASAGASLVMQPPGLVAECARSGKLDESVLENLNEVLNVVAGLFNGLETPHVKFGAVTCGPKPPDAVVALAKNPATRLDVQLSIAGYVGGKLTLLGT